MVSSLMLHREREKLVRLGGNRYREREYCGGGDGRGRKHESDERSARGGDAGTSDRGSEIGDASDRKWSRYDGVSSRDSSRNCGRNSSRYETGVREYIRNPTGREKDRGHFRDWESSAESTPGRERERENARLRKRDTKTDSNRSRQQRCWGLVNGESGGRRLPSPLFGRPSLVTSSTGGLSSSQLMANEQESSGEQFEVNSRETSDSEAGRRSGVIVCDKKGSDVYREPGEEGNLSSDLATPQRARSSSRSLNLHSSEPGGRSSRSPPKKRKFSPIFWDCDEKQSRRSKVTSVSSSSSGLLSMSGISSVETVTVSSLQQQSVVGRLAPASTHANNYVSPPQPLSSARIRTPCVSVGSQLERTISSTSAQSKSFPLLGQTKNSSTTNEEREYPDAHMLDQVMASPMSDDKPEAGQVLPEQECPKGEEEEEDGGCRPVFVTVAASRWAKDSVTSENKISSRLRVVRKGRGRPLSLTPKKIEPRTSAELFGGRGAEKVNDIDGSVGHGSGSKDRLSDSYEDGEYKREWMDLGVENLDHEVEEQVPKVGTEYEVLLSPPVSQLRAIDMLQGCRSVDEFERLNTIDEGAYGVVYQARNKKTGEVVALKKVKMENQQEGFPITSLREINILLSIHHPSIVDVKEVVVGKTIDSIYMVMEYMEHDLKGLMEALKQPFCQSEVKCLMLQLFEGTKYLHDNWVLHRDFKTSNLLLNNKGELKICDFGLARQYGSPSKAYSHMVVTLWYRAPELLLGSRQYSAPIDMWSLGCIMAEFLGKEPLFNGKSEIDQIDKIFKILGTPSEKMWPDFVNLPGAKCNFVRQQVHSRLREKFPATSFSGRPALSESGYNLLNGLLTYDPRKRLTAEEALNHEWFREVPLPKSKQFMPTFPARSQHDRRFRRLRKHSDPLEEQRKRELRQGEVGARGFFG